MSISEPFIRRPVATTLLTLGVLLAGLFAFVRLPVATLPQVDFPVFVIEAQMAGASPETMSTTVAAPLERRLGAIADVTEMSSTNSTGITKIVLLFGLNRNVDGAARDVQAAINAARTDLPVALRENPTYRKYNPADAPIIILGLTSNTLTPGQIYDAADSIAKQRLSRLSGVGNVEIVGSSLPAVRVELNPNALYHYGVGLEGIRAALASANANSPKGALEFGERRYQLYANDQIRKAQDYRDLLVAYRNGAGVRLSDVGQVVDGVEDQRNLGIVGGQRGVLLLIYKQPGSNIVETIGALKTATPKIASALPGGITLRLMGDQSINISASLAATEETLVIAVGLVVIVTFVFLRSWRATLIAAVAVPISVIGTFSAMYLLNYSLNVLSLMALVIGTSFVVDDAIVVLENIQRHIEAGKLRLEAALDGVREVGSTVVSMTISLMAVILPISLMGGLIGRIFQEFAVTLALAVLISLLVSLTTTPMMCARLLRPEVHGSPGAVVRTLERAFTALLAFYERTLMVALRHPRLVLLSLAATVGLNVCLYAIVPKGFFPQQDNGQLSGRIQADQSISFQSMEEKLRETVGILQSDPAVESVVGVIGGRGSNVAEVFVGLKSLDQRDSVSIVMERLRNKFTEVAGVNLYISPDQDLQLDGFENLGQYQYVLMGDSAEEVYTAARRLIQALKKNPVFSGVIPDLQDTGLERRLVIDQATAFRYGITPDKISDTLYDAFGQRQVSTIYAPVNQYHVVMEIAPRYLQSPEALRQVYVSTSGGKARGSAITNGVFGTVSGATASTVTAAATGLGAANIASPGMTAPGWQPSVGAPSTSTTSSGTDTSAADIASDSARNAASNAIAANKGGASSSAPVSPAKETMIPIKAFARFETGTTPLQIDHRGLFVSTSIALNLTPGHSLSEANVAIEAAMAELSLPATIQGEFASEAREYQTLVSRQPFLILAAILVVYVVLGILYESFVHPIVILSTLPSAGVGAVLALLVTGTEFTVIALIAVFLLIGIVIKNAIMMINVAIDLGRTEGVGPEEAITRACLLRFRPITMTSLAAILGAVPLFLARGGGMELREPLGIAIAGGLIVSQGLTLYTTPVVYLAFERMQHLFLAHRRGWLGVG